MKKPPSHKGAEVTIRGATLLNRNMLAISGYLESGTASSDDTLGSDNGALSVKAYSLDDHMTVFDFGLQLPGPFPFPRQYRALTCPGSL